MSPAETNKLLTLRILVVLALYFWATPLVDMAYAFFKLGIGEKSAITFALFGIFAVVTYLIFWLGNRAQEALLVDKVFAAIFSVSYTKLLRQTGKSEMTYSFNDFLKGMIVVLVIILIFFAWINWSSLIAPFNNPGALSSWKFLLGLVSGVVLFLQKRD